MEIANFIKLHSFSSDFIPGYATGSSKAGPYLGFSIGGKMFKKWYKVYAFFTQTEFMDWHLWIDGSIFPDGKMTTWLVESV